MTPTEDDYADGASSTTEYERETCCIGYLKILGESYRAMDGSSAPKCSKSSKSVCNCRKRFFPHGRCRDVLGIVISLPIALHNTTFC